MTTKPDDKCHVNEGLRPVHKKKPLAIQKIKQKNNFDCSRACLKMLTGWDYDRITEIVGYEAGDIIPVTEWGRAWTSTTDNDIVHVLWRAGMEPMSYDLRWWGNTYRRGISNWEFYMYLLDRVAIITVPSLNYEGSFHSIIYNRGEIIDPSKKKQYNKDQQFMYSDIKDAVVIGNERKIKVIK